MCHWKRRLPSERRHLLGEHRLAGAGLALDEEGTLSVIAAFTRASGPSSAT
jgi:hypothetical protein